VLRAPSVVLDAYLRAYRAADCETAHALWVGRKEIGGGDLCGATRLSASIDGELVFATRLTTGGSDDGSVRTGDFTWFLTLKGSIAPIRGWLPR
jgi:hypothetical protein